MKLKNEINVAAFLEAVKECEGSVYFKTVEGDQLNLKSLLSQYILIYIMENNELMEEGVIDCSLEKDYALLEKFFL